MLSAPEPVPLPRWPLRTPAIAGQSVGENGWRHRCRALMSPVYRIPPAWRQWVIENPAVLLCPCHKLRSAHARCAGDAHSSIHPIEAWIAQETGLSVSANKLKDRKSVV